jgi:hypothetical protein
VLSIISPAYFNLFSFQEALIRNVFFEAIKENKAKNSKVNDKGETVATKFTGLVQNLVWK